MDLNIILNVRPCSVDELTALEERRNLEYGEVFN